MALKRAVEERFGHVRLRGEISGLKRAASGHVYLTLKDDKAVIDGVIWKGAATRLSFRPEDGLEVVCTGKLTIYPGRSKYQIVIEQMAPAGAGALMALLEERKKKLSAEGLFAEERKKTIPYLPDVIGVVTSPTGAVIRDILHRLEERFPRRVLVWPVMVQGDGAAEQIAGAIAGFNALSDGGDIPRPDVLIVARGGGSLEDLWAFNEEIVVRAAASSEIPLISAVGHETDTTLIDYAADLRAPTPTAAAEKAVPVRADLLYSLQDLNSRMRRAATRQGDEKSQQLKSLYRGMPRLGDLLGLPTQKFDDLSDRLPRSLAVGLQVHESRFQGLNVRLTPRQLKRQADTLQQRLQNNTIRYQSGLRMILRDGVQRYDSIASRVQRSQLQRIETGLTDQIIRLKTRLRRCGPRQLEAAQAALAGPARLLESLSYKNVLNRGYALVHDEEGQPITRAKGLATGDAFTVEFADGKRQGRVEGSGQVRSSSAQTGRAAKSKKTPNKNHQKDQGSLF